jgi:hypothetical protein
MTKMLEKVYPDIKDLVRAEGGRVGYFSAYKFRLVYMQENSPQTSWRHPFQNLISLPILARGIFAARPSSLRL